MSISSQDSIRVYKSIGVDGADSAHHANSAGDAESSGDTEGTDDTNGVKMRDDLLEGLQKNQNGLFFDSYGAAYKHYIDNPRWEPPMLTSPPDEADKIEKVQRLQKAIVNVKGILDNKNDRLNRFIELSYDAPAIEFVAQKLYAFLVDLHTVGWTIPILDPTKFADSCFEKTLTYDERFKHIEDLLETRKACCKSLLDGRSYVEIIGGPRILAKAYRGNQRGNGRKQKLINAGREKLNLPITQAISGMKRRASNISGDTEEDDTAGAPTAAAERQQHFLTPSLRSKAKGKNKGKGIARNTKGLNDLAYDADQISEEDSLFRGHGIPGRMSASNNVVAKENTMRVLRSVSQRSDK